MSHRRTASSERSLQPSSPSPTKRSDHVEKKKVTTSTAIPPLLLLPPPGLPLFPPRDVFSLRPPAPPPPPLLGSRHPRRCCRQPSTPCLTKILQRTPRLRIRPPSRPCSDGDPSTPRSRNLCCCRCCCWCCRCPSEVSKSSGNVRSQTKTMAIPTSTTMATAAFVLFWRRSSLSPSAEVNSCYRCPGPGLRSSPGRTEPIFD